MPQDAADDPRHRADGYEEMAKELLSLAGRAGTDVARRQFAVLASLYESLARQTRTHFSGSPDASVDADSPERTQ